MYCYDGDAMAILEPMAQGCDTLEVLTQGTETSEALMALRSHYYFSTAQLGAFLNEEKSTTNLSH